MSVIVCADHTLRPSLPTEDRAYEHPAEVSLVVKRIEILRHHVASQWIHGIIWEFRNRSGRRQSRHVAVVPKMFSKWGQSRASRASAKRRNMYLVISGSTCYP
jgi:hypothetical protein